MSHKIAVLWAITAGTLLLHGQEFRATLSGRVLDSAGQAIANVKTVPSNGQLVRTARDTGISFGAPDEAQYHRPNSKSGEIVSACG